MKKVLLFTLVGLFSALMFAQEETTKKGKFDITASMHNQWYWRGYAVGPDPIVAAQASFKYGGFEIGTWNGYGLSGMWKDTDLYISYTTKSGFSIALWDVFNYSDYTASNGFAGYGNHSQANYFNFTGDQTRHFFDLSVNYTLPKTNLNLFFATIIEGRDRNPDQSNRYSSYFKASYGFDAGNNISVSPYVSFGFAFNSDDGGTFWQWTNRAVADANDAGINEIGINISKPVKISETYSVKANAGVVASPINHTITGLFGVTFF
ncbi:hypothetical protein [Flavivirga jejuensis]|uniref:Outer membrane beta-barrel porin/alpha-amylase n=1 Tax=Flavivirga jejuensis TaxID=870487 RepID=A0ABT8WKD5_9FLAO|nr:hypothetical protein [Flavivirga jejuensis]MDO5973621.1 hypothetical protein [Flavivirga jejuensis]